MKLPTVAQPPSPKLRQKNCRLTDQQFLALQRHCVRTGQTASDVIVAALAMVVEGFDNNGVDQ